MGSRLSDISERIKLLGAELKRLTRSEFLQEVIRQIESELRHYSGLKDDYIVQVLSLFAHASACIQYISKRG